MHPFTRLTAIALPLVRPNIDTDAIIPSREMKSVFKAGLADGLFAGWRYISASDRSINRDFVLNDPAYAGAAILLGGENFGCGSSREHAVWALAEYGFRAIVAPSFSPIFQNNCVRNGVLAACAPQRFIEKLAKYIADDPKGRHVSIDLPSQSILSPEGAEAQFEIEEESKEMLLEGLDVIALTLKSAPAIEAFRKRDQQTRRWAYLRKS